MASSLYNLALDFSKELNYTKAIMARQGDKGITVTVKPFLNGLQMDTSGGTFTLKGTTPSNRYVDSVATSVTSEEVTFSLDGTFMSEAGYYKHCYVEYRKDNQILTTQDIIFFSLGVSDISQGQADEYVSQLEELIRKYNETFDAFMAEIKGRVDSLNQQINDLTGQAKTLQDKLDALKEEISKLGNLQVMYSNSIDFGGYDYSGNPNIAPVINDGNVSSINEAWTKVTPHGTFATCEKIGTNLSVGVGMVPWKRYDFSKLTVGKQYSLTIPIRINADFTGEISSIFIRMRCVNTDGDVILDTKMLPSNTPKEEFVDISHAFTVPSTVQNSNNWYCQVGFSADSDARGTVDIGYDVKLEEGSTATPYQPNLLDAPYYLSKVALGENIANKSVAFPIESSAYEIYKGNTEEDLVIGQTYTITLKGTKPVSYTFAVHNDETIYFGDLMPVEGLTDVWSLTFTPTKIASNAPKEIRIFQYRSSIEGACQIDWLKIEKGNTRTPNIEQYKYRGIGMRDSNNPKDYVWDLAPEYVEDNLATDVKISEITGKANNYTDNSIAAVNTNLVNTADDLARQINSNKTAAESYADTKKTEAVNESKKYTDEAITNITPNRTSLRIESGFSDGFTGWVTFERIGDIVIVSYALSPSTNTGTWKTPLPIASIPEEFRFSSNAYSTGSIATSNISNDICQVGMNGQGLQFASWNRTAGIAQFAGQLTGAVKSREK
ncbi:BppU family phage baseplate upper protein [Enterococcus faecium]|uniref:BppU family phage baseplate upper protein n=1 Tax=Enterococcus faecium TaxID=1352 RepID=UPI00338D8B92